jgi:hypothetical protein
LRPAERDPADFAGAAGAQSQKRRVEKFNGVLKTDSVFFLVGLTFVRILFERV